MYMYMYIQTDSEVLGAFYFLFFLMYFNLCYNFCFFLKIYPEVLLCTSLHLHFSGLLFPFFVQPYRHDAVSLWRGAASQKRTPFLGPISAIATEVT